MTVDFNRLKTMSQKELVELARQLNAPHHHANKAETLIENIINKVMEQSLTHPDQKTEEVRKVKEAVFITEDQLEAAFAPIKARTGAFSTNYDHEAMCVTMIYNDGRYRHRETMSLSCSMTKFMRKANEIAKGPLVVRAMKAEEWGNLGGNKGDNDYTNKVLAG